MSSWQTQTSVTALSSTLKRRRLSGARSLDSYRLLRTVATLKVPGVPLGFRAISTEPLESRKNANSILSDTDDVVPRLKNENDDDDEEEKPGIYRIQVSRQKYIPVSKAELLDAVVSRLFDSREEDARQFRLLASCLDSILHAEHKDILEQMRSDYYYLHSIESNSEQVSVSESEVVANGESSNFTGDSIESDTVAVATRFQRSFMQLLNDAQFEELSVRDLMLTNALNTDYLLTLPIYVDWKKASESNAIIFRRGYATERQKGLMIVEKLDYLQSRLLRGIFSFISKPLGKVGKWITYNLNEAFKDSDQKDEAGDWVRRLKLWLEEMSLFQQSYLNDEKNSENPLGVDQLSDRDLPIWLAAQRAVSRYEGFLSATGPRGRLLRKLLARVGFIAPTPETPFQLDSDGSFSEPYLRPTFLSRISLSDIWRPATRKYCGNDVWKMLKTSVSILLSQSILQEPAFGELILLYTKDFADGDIEDNFEAQVLQLKIYERIPIPDLPVVFPHKKLSFRIIDTVRLDIATILGLSAFLINYKFEDILASPSAIFLDAVAIIALIIYVSRVALGYKQTWDRYQLLVNKTLYEKTLASGFGSVHFLLDASEQQQYKEAILTYAILLNTENGQANCYQQVGDRCERFIYDIFKQKVEMPVNKAVSTLVRLGLVTETIVDGRLKLQAIPCPKAYEALKYRWESLLG
ncbi:putative plastid-lipid-associated protein 10 [Hibiscus syriacus]|uniref:Plastid-lipid-associated protein 10 n=1 Tax=Hibiscus syriacus TaxID=106335 RepID=A0A6A3AHM9_HIBSY|nr:putative plastid-lipid-associated protein 10 [Hibiscus syriacus]